MISKIEKRICLVTFIFVILCLFFVIMHVRASITREVDTSIKIDLDSLDVAMKYLGLDYCVIKDNIAYLTYAGKEFDILKTYEKTKRLNDERNI